MDQSYIPNDIIKKDNYHGPLLGKIVNIFKGNITKYANKHDIVFARQGRFHDHIIRNEHAYDKIINYIQNNPKNWENDIYA